jgi:hypothetical protein
MNALLEEVFSLHERIGSLLKNLAGVRKEEVEDRIGEEEGVQVAEVQESKEPSPENVIEVEAERKIFESNGQERKKPNQSELIRGYIRRHGLEVRNKDVVEAIRNEEGVEVSHPLVSYIKSKLANSSKSGIGTKKGPGRGKRAEGARKTLLVQSASSFIRDYLEKQGLDSSNEEVVKHLKSKGIEARPTLVSSVRANMKKKGFKTSRVSTNKKGRRKGPTMIEVAVEILKNGPKSGMELSDVAEKALRSGYKYEGRKNLAGLTQNVYQALHTLTKTIPHKGFKGKVAVVKKDGHLYKLNPKAKVA